MGINRYTGNAHGRRGCCGVFRNHCLANQIALRLARNNLQQTRLDKWIEAVDGRQYRSGPDKESTHYDASQNSEWSEHDNFRVFGF